MHFVAVVGPVRALQKVVLSESNVPVAEYEAHAADAIQFVPLNKQPAL